MRTSRGGLLAVVLCGALAVTAGCGDKAGSGTAAPASAAASSAAASSAAPSPQVDARAELVAAFGKNGGVPTAYTTETATGTVATTKLAGAADPANRANQGTMVITTQGQTITAQVITLGTDLYLKMDVALPGVDAKKWMYIDGSKTSLSKLGLGDPDDPANIKGLGNTIVTAERTGAGAYKGTLDLTKRAVPDSGKALIEQMGDAAKAVPFEATTNADGYLTSFTMTMPGAGAVPSTTSKSMFTDFGKPVSITKPPAAEVQPAPALLLKQFA